MEDVDPAGVADDESERSSTSPEQDGHDELLVTQEVGNRTYIIARVEPLDVDGVRTVSVITSLWLLAFLVLLPFQTRLHHADRLWWLWTCVVGLGLGLVGLTYCLLRRRQRRRLGEAGA